MQDIREYGPDVRVIAPWAGPGDTHISTVSPDPQNRRQHSPRNIGQIVDALHKVGAARSIVIDEHGTVLAGNGVVEAAAEAGITRLKVVDVDGNTLVAVRRSGLDAEQKRQLAMFDNRAGELSTWNPEQLRADVNAGLDLTPWFTPDELARLAAEPSSVVDDPLGEWKNMPAFEREQPAHRVITVYFQSAAGVDQFADLLGQSITPKTKYLWFPPKAKVPQDDDTEQPAPE